MFYWFNTRLPYDLPELDQPPYEPRSPPPPLRLKDFSRFQWRPIGMRAFEADRARQVVEDMRNQAQKKVIHELQKRESHRFYTFHTQQSADAVDRPGA